MTPTLTYEETGHRYSLDGRPVPGITSMLAQLGYNGAGAAYFTEASRQLGTAVHRACAIVDRYAPTAETLNEVLGAGVFSVPLHPDLHPYVAGWLLFKREHGLKAVEWERRVYSEGLMTAGTLDVYGQIVDGSYAIVDVKTWKSPGAKPKRSAELQLAAYAMMAAGRPVHYQSIQRWTVVLPGNGRYRQHKCVNFTDFDVVRAVARVWWDLNNAGLLKLSGEPEEQEDGNA